MAFKALICIVLQLVWPHICAVSCGKILKMTQLHGGKCSLNSVIKEC